MKFLEKMALEGAETFFDHEYIFQRDAYLGGFTAGFRAAREMAARLAYDYSDESQTTGPTLDSRIKQIGEQEMDKVTK